MLQHPPVSIFHIFHQWQAATGAGLVPVQRAGSTQEPFCGLFFHDGHSPGGHIFPHNVKKKKKKWLHLLQRSIGKKPLATVPPVVP